MNKEIILFLRKSYNLTQRDFAKLVNCSYALIALVEIGKRNVSKKLESKIVDTFDLDEIQVQSITSIVSEISKNTPPFF